MTRVSSTDMSIPDSVWLVRYCNGDPDAARVLTARLAPKAFSYAMRLLHDRAEAEDVAQEGMLRLWNRAANWDQGGPAQPATWLLRVVRNLCIDRLRRASGIPQAMSDDEWLDRIADTGPSAASIVLEKSRSAALETALATLPSRQREAVVLRHLEEMANPEIAAIMDISVEAVESLIARGRRALKENLAQRRFELGYEDDPRP
ncbi:sigma-70 family RNA polymerase sigma factor [Tropicimonas sp. S265A]|uniref:sigma-70 family RNA polymerase sigma factor n=1 Tax=Tropicimonas sp. S265A TaxID=3415134 RepID=UPI003C7BBC2D